MKQKGERGYPLPILAAVIALIALTVVVGMAKVIIWAIGVLG